MDALKNMLSPFGMSSGGIQDTLVCMQAYHGGLYYNATTFRNWSLLVELLRVHEGLQCLLGTALSTVRTPYNTYKIFVKINDQTCDSILSHCPFRINRLPI